jgi:hypothetical protein
MGSPTVQKNIFSGEILRKAYEEYKNLRQDIYYKLYYKVFGDFEKIKDNILINSVNDTELCSDFRSLDNQFKYFFKEKWGIWHPISPYLRLKDKDLSSSVLKSNSALVKLIYAFRISSDVAILISKPKRKVIHPIWYYGLWKTKPQKIAVSKTRLKEDEKRAKYLIYVLVTRIKIECRYLGRVFKVSKDTIRNWVDEVENWDVIERQEMERRLITGRKLANKDILNLHSSKLVPYHKVEYGMSDDGFQDSGKTSPHKDFFETE